MPCLLAVDLAFSAKKKRCVTATEAQAQRGVCEKVLQPMSSTPHGNAARPTVCRKLVTGSKAASRASSSRSAQVCQRAPCACQCPVGSPSDAQGVLQPSRCCPAGQKVVDGPAHGSAHGASPTIGAATQAVKGLTLTAAAAAASQAAQDPSLPNSGRFCPAYITPCR